MLCLRNKKDVPHFVTDDKRDIVDQKNPPNSDAHGHFNSTTLRIKKRKEATQGGRKKKE
jgi:hypothetical protein